MSDNNYIPYPDKNSVDYDDGLIPVGDDGDYIIPEQYKRPVGDAGSSTIYEVLTVEDGVVTDSTLWSAGGDLRGFWYQCRFIGVSVEALPDEFTRR